MNRTQLIQGYIDLTVATSYLEIGLGDCRNFDAIICKYKNGVDPLSTESHSCDVGIYSMTSDEYFKGLQYHRPSEHFGARYDIIFIDGLHEYTQVLRDIQNAMKYLSPNGLILLHDTNPPDAHTARPLSELEKYPPDGEAWTGDVWKAVCVLNWHCIKHHTHPDDYGLTVIRKHDVQKFEVTDFIKTASYEYFDTYRDSILGMLPPNTPARLP